MKVRNQLIKGFLLSISILAHTLSYGQETPQWQIEIGAQTLEKLGWSDLKNNFLNQPNLKIYWSRSKFSLGLEGGLLEDKVSTLYDQYPEIMGLIADQQVNSDSWKSSYLLIGPSYKLFDKLGLSAAVGLKGGLQFLNSSPDLIIIDKVDPTRIYQQYQPVQEKSSQFLLKPSLDLQFFPGNSRFGFNFSAALLNGAKQPTSNSSGLDLSQQNFPNDLPEPDQIRKVLLRFPSSEVVEEPQTKGLALNAGISVKLGGKKPKQPKAQPIEVIPPPKPIKDKEIVADKGDTENSSQNKSASTCICENPAGLPNLDLVEVKRLWPESPYVLNLFDPTIYLGVYAGCHPTSTLSQSHYIIGGTQIYTGSGIGEYMVEPDWTFLGIDPEEVIAEVYAFGDDTCHYTHVVPIPEIVACGALLGGVPEPTLDLVVLDTTDMNTRTLINAKAKGDFILANNGWSSPTQTFELFTRWTPIQGVASNHQPSPLDSIEHTFSSGELTTFGHMKTEYWVWEGGAPVCRKVYDVYFSNDTLSSNLFAGEDGEFEITNPAGGGYSYTPGVPFSGEGEVWIPAMASTVSLEFQDIKADNTGRLVDGEIVAKVDTSAPTYPLQWALGALSSTIDYDHAQVQSVMEWSDTNLPDVPFLGTTGPLAPLGDPAINMPMVLNLDAATESRFAITEMIFEPNMSKFNAVLALAAPAEWNATDLIGFIAKGIPFHPTEIDSPPERIEIVDDILLNNVTSDIAFAFKKAAVPYDPYHQGCYIAWDEDGFSQFGIELEASFTRDWFTPIPDDGVSKSAATFVGTGAAWNDMVISGDWPKSKIESAHNMTIEVDDINLDLSDSFNPLDIDFPAVYDSIGVDTTSLWRGFFAKNIELGLPDSWETNSGGQPKLGVSDMFIDDQGLTMLAYAHDVVQWPKANISDLYASVDTINVQWLLGSLTQAEVIGRIGLPASHPDSIQNPLRYNGFFMDSLAISLDTTLNLPGTLSDKSLFALVISPDGPVNANLLKGDLELDPTSQIVAYKQDTVKHFSMSLDGALKYVNKKLGPLNNINMEFGFQGLGFEYNSTDSLQFEKGTWSLASPQKKAHGFPLTINNVEYNPLPKTGSQKLHGSIDFDVTFSIGDTSSAFSAGSAMGIEFEVVDSPADSLKFKPNYLGLDLDSLGITANLAAVNLSGYITIDTDDPMYGQRFTGGLSAYFKGPGIGASVAGMFGNTNYNHTSTYKYWNVDAGVVFGSAIPFLSGMGFYGFSGGAYYNMGLNLVETAPDTYAKTYIPDYNGLGFKAGATIGTMPLQDAFNADITLEAAFSLGGGGIQYIGFEGDFGTNAVIPDRRLGKGKINGNVLTFYDFPNKHFFLGASATINSPPITTPSPISLALDINGLTSDWYFVCGKPDYDPAAPHELNEVNLNFDSTGVGINLYEYFMFGNSIPYPNGFTHKFRDAYYNKLGSYPGFGTSVGSGGVDSNSELGKGMALGIGFQFDKSGEQHITGAFHLGYELAAGAEVNLSYMRYAGGCGVAPDYFNPIGTNGWRAKGNLGLYAVAAARVDKKDNAGNVTKTWNIADLRAGAWITGEFPNPHYAAGAIDGQAQIGHWVGKAHPLGHWNPNFPWLWQESCDHYVDKYLLNIDIHKEFEVGHACTNPADNTTPAFEQENVTDDFNDILVRHVSPLQNFNFPESSPVTVGFNFTPDEVFHVSEQQSSGAIINRTFKLVFTRNMKRKTSSGTWVNEFTSYQVNDLGEYQFIKMPAIGAAPATIATTALPSSSGSGTTLASSGVTPLTGGSGSLPGYATLLPASLASLGGSPSLPPPPPPPLVNTLSINTYYRFTVEATLMEYNYNTATWSPAVKSDGMILTDSITKTFRTGPIEPWVGTTGSLSTY